MPMLLPTRGLFPNAELNLLSPGSGCPLPGSLRTECCGVCVFITAVPITKLFAGEGEGGEGRTCATRDYEPRPV